mmetsp:Transcript_116146/g.182717  ORF Transcript_116146/g.182717 Transcript_116146/m.182717 type:complete len:486 (-) Transcript_116146:16-1473(-)
MPLRPASAPTSHNDGLAQQRRGLARTGNRVQFAGPEAFGSQCGKRLPKDPLPDSDDECENQDSAVTQSPSVAGTLSTPRKNTEVKWWHVTDTQIEDLVQKIEHTSTPDLIGTLTSTPSLAASASQSACHILRSPSFAASSTCRALAGSGRPKLRSPPSKAVFFDACQTDLFATSCSLPHCYGSPEMARSDFSSASETSTATPQKPKFNHVSSAKMALLDSRPPPFGVHSKRPFTAPEMSQCRLDANSSEKQRPWSSSSSGDTRSRVKRHTTGNTKLSSSTLKQCSVSEKDLIQVELAFYNGTERILVLIHPDALMGPIPGQKERLDKASLKGMVAKLTGICVSDQRLLCRGFDVSYDHKSLRNLGISDGSIVMVYDKKDWQRTQTDVILACTAKLLQKQEAAQQQAKRRASLAKDKKGISPKIMPKWGWGTPPSAAFARKGWHATGQDMTLRFEDHFSWRDVEEAPSLSGIRASPTFTQPLEYVP